MFRAVRALVPLCAASTLALAPAVAHGHEGNPNFRSELHPLPPTLAGVTAEVLNFDDTLRVQNRSDSTLLIRGYDDEPYVRIEPDRSVWVNTRSPAHYLNDDRYGEGAVPESADSSAKPVWEQVDSSGEYAWHDHRIHYMSRATPPQVVDEGVRTKVFDYEVPVEIDGQEAAIAGTLYWVPQESGPPVAAIAGLAVLVVGGATAVWLGRRRRSSAAREDKEAW